MNIPSTIDNTLTRDGMHVMHCFVQYFPYGAEEKRQEFQDNIINIIDNYAPGFKQSILHAQLLTPQDLEKNYGLTGGNIFHGSMNLNQLLFMRPAPGFSQYRLGKGFYLCGSGAHPGGGVTGMPGHNAARVILKEN